MFKISNSKNTYLKNSINDAKVVFLIVLHIQNKRINRYATRGTTNWRLGKLLTNILQINIIIYKKLATNVSGRKKISRSFFGRKQHESRIVTFFRPETITARFLRLFIPESNRGTLTYKVNALPTKLSKLTTALHPPTQRSFKQ